MINHNIELCIRAAARFENEAVVIEHSILRELTTVTSRRALRPLVIKRRRVGKLRSMGDDAARQVEHLRKLDGDNTIDIIRTGDMIAVEMQRQRYEALVNIKAV